MQLAHHTYGNPDNPPVLLLHGFMSSRYQWMGNQDALSEHFFLVMVELWGHGDSPAPTSNASYNTSTYVAEFERIRKNLGLARWHLIGQSYGAGLIIAYAIAHPERTQAVVITNSRSALATGPVKPRSAPSAAKKAPAEFNPRRLPYHPIHARRFPNDVRDALVTTADAIDALTIELTSALAVRLNSIDAIASLLNRLLIVNGVFEKSFQQDMKVLKQRYPDLESIDLEGGHSVNIEAADGFNEAVIQFFNRAASTT